MKTITFWIVVNYTSSQQAFGQVSDDFADGDFTTAPAWTGTDAKFSVNANRLKLQAPAVADFAYLSTTSESVNDAQWEFYVRMEFNPSSSNYARVYLTSSSSDLSGELNGYFVGIGNSSDDISLYRQSGSTVSTKLIDGVDNRLNLSIIDVKIKVTRDASGNWALYSDVGLTGVYSQEGTSTFDNTFSISQYFGVYCYYSATRSDKFYFDDIQVSGDPFVDTQPPLLETVEILSSNSLQLTFSEELEEANAENIGNYLLNGSISPDYATLNEDDLTVLLEFNNPFPNGVESQLTVTGVTDVTGNVMSSMSKSFLYFQPSPVSFRDVIITELFPDYTPSVGLPESEFVEIYNRSNNPIDLAGWQITDKNSTGVLSSQIILPGAYSILTSTAASSSYSDYGSVSAVSNFPTLNNASDILILNDNNGNLIDSVHYYDDWFNDVDKMQGGWTLERIDPENTCKESENWKASIASEGGTPGATNSVNEILIDVTGPKLIEASQINESLIELTFDEKLAEQLPGLIDFSFVPSLNVVQVISNTNQTGYQISTLEQIEEGRSYKISVANIYDCPGNVIADNNKSIYLNRDDLAPSVDSSAVISEKSILLRFNERINKLDAEDITNYTTTASGLPANAQLQADLTTVIIDFAEPFTNGLQQRLFITNIRDINSNRVNDSIDFLYFKASPVSRRDILITEIFPDPSPAVGLPEGEFIEVYNRSQYPINLQGWQLHDATSVSVLPSKIILPQEYVVITSATFFKAYDSISSNVISVSKFISLNNTSDILVLRSSDSLVVDSLKYSNKWYSDEDKQDGGWTLELINPDDICNGEFNWKASIDSVFGGTPGKQNSIFSNMPDTTPPTIIGIKELDSVTLELTFDETLGAVCPSKENFVFEPLLGIDSVNFKDNQRLALFIFLTDPIRKGKSYSLEVNNIGDCPGNLILPDRSTIHLNPDSIPPSLTKVIVQTPSSVSLHFSEPISDQGISTDDFLVNGILSPDSLAIQNDLNQITLFFSVDFPNGVEQVLDVSNIEDINGNLLQETTGHFMYFNQSSSNENDVIITEIFSDPAPSAGLPEFEYIEIFNKSTEPFQLQQWKIQDGTTSAILPSTILFPKEYVILCSFSAASKLSAFGKVVAVSNFPSLNNSADVLILRNEHGKLIDSVYYSSDWYGDNEKSEGGYSLEIIDPNNLCSQQDNWIATEADVGGTPGQQNSVFADKPDLTAPRLMQVNVVSENQIELIFNENLEKSLPPLSAFTFSEHSITSISFVNNTLTGVSISVDHPFQSGKAYTITALHVRDCSGNKIDPEHNSLAFGLPETADPGDIIINEILFNPRPQGVDFIEIYNTSAKYINLEKFKLANLEGDSLINLKEISALPLLVAPLSYLVLTTDTEVLKNDYLNGKEKCFYEMKSIPSMNDDSGNIALVDTSTQIVDMVSYTDKMHSVFLKDNEGVSLERIRPEAPASDPENWKSASQQSGFATPGYLNSNAQIIGLLNEENVIVSPEVFEPQFGTQDFATISYHFDNGGMIANVKIFDSSGRLVKTVTENEILGTEGFLRWDGDQDNGTKARVGSYVVWFQIFDSSGKVSTIRKRIAVATRF